MSQAHSQLIREAAEHLTVLFSQDSKADSQPSSNSEIPPKIILMIEDLSRLLFPTISFTLPSPSIPHAPSRFFLFDNYPPFAESNVREASQLEWCARLLPANPTMSDTRAKLWFLDDGGVDVSRDQHGHVAGVGDQAHEDGVLALTAGHED